VAGQGLAWRGRARRGLAWFGMARSGVASHGWARRGMAGLGMVILLAAPATAVAPSAPRSIPDAAFAPVTVPQVIYDFPEPMPGQRPVIKLPNKPIVEVQHHVDRSRPEASIGRSISGQASWYCRAGVSACRYAYPDGPGFDAYAAAGPKLRAALGDWRGRVVTVNGIRVKLIDWCQCSKGKPGEKIIDLYFDVARALGITGVGPVTIRW